MHEYTFLQKCSTHVCPLLPTPAFGASPFFLRLSVMQLPSQLINPPLKKIGLNTVQTQVHSNKQWFPVGYSAKQPSVNVVRTHFHKDNSPCPPFPLKKSVSVGDMVSSTYLERRKLKMFEDEDGCTVVRFDGKHNKNVTFRNELRSLGLRILSPSTWTLMR